MSLGPDTDIPVGTIICCYKDMGYIRVDKVTPEGVIANCAFGPFLYTWRSLEDLWARIDSQPGDPNYPLAAATSRPPRLAKRGGSIGFRQGVPTMHTDGPDQEARELDLAIMRELVTGAPADWQEIFLQVDEADLLNPPRAIMIDVLTSSSAAQTQPITSGLADLLRESRYTHANGYWSGIELKITRLDEYSGRYRAEFGYQDKNANR